MTDPFSIVIITGSPTRPSRTLGLVQSVEHRLTREAFRVRTIHVRDLPAQALLHAKTDDPAIAEAIALVEQADGVVVASPVYKASYTGVLKAFIDLFPQFALRGKVVLPLLTGGTVAHVLALDYALRPALQSLDPRLVVGGLFVLDKAITLTDDGVKLDPEVAPRLEQVTQTFIDGLRAHA
ncbi:MAG TPA: NADPH-dependent FMN reductase [Polyangiales bacterium]